MARPAHLDCGNPQLTHRVIRSDAAIAAASPSAMFSVVAQKAPLSAIATDGAKRPRGAIETA